MVTCGDYTLVVTGTGDNITPLVSVVAIERKASLLDLQRLWTAHPYTRIPVYDARVDCVVGVAYAMDVVDYLDSPTMLSSIRVEAVMRPADFFGACLFFDGFK